MCSVNSSSVYIQISIFYLSFNRTTVLQSLSNSHKICLFLLLPSSMACTEFLLHSSAAITQQSELLLTKSIVAHRSGNDLWNSSVHTWHGNVLGMFSNGKLERSVLRSNGMARKHSH